MEECEAQTLTYRKRCGLEEGHRIGQLRSGALVDPDVLGETSINVNADVTLDAGAVLAASLPVTIVGPAAVGARATGVQGQPAHDAVTGGESSDIGADGRYGACTLVRRRQRQSLPRIARERARPHHRVRVAV